MGQLSPGGFNHKPLQVFNRESFQMFLFETIFIPDYPAIRQQMFPAANTEKFFIDLALIFKAMGFEKERFRCIDAFW